MKKFIIKTILFLSIVPVLYGIIYTIYDYKLNHLSEDPDQIIIWGDSQAYQGIDIPTLEKHTNKNVITAAKHGAGVYDFLVFTKKVPKNSTVIVSLSKPVQIRRKRVDRNKSGLSISAIKILFNCEYGLTDVLRVIKRNLKPEKIFSPNTHMYPNKGKLSLSEPISLFSKTFATLPNYIKNKQAVLKEGLRNLNLKNCKIILLNYPFHPILKTFENNSEIQITTQVFENEIRDEYKISQVDTITLDTSKEVMYDLTHLNKEGAFQVTHKLSKLIEQNNSKNQMYSIVWRENITNPYSKKLLNNYHKNKKNNY